MTDPRYTDPRYRDLPIDAGLRRGQSSASMWGWIAGLVVIALIAFVVASGWNGNTRTAANGPHATVGSGAMTQPVPPPTTTGQGGPVMVPPAPTKAPTGAK